MEAWQRPQSFQLLHFVHRSCLMQCKAENPLACMLGENPFGLGLPVQGCLPVVEKRCTLQYCCRVTTSPLFHFSPSLSTSFAHLCPPVLLLPFAGC